MALAHVKFSERGNFVYEAWLLRHDDRIVGINIQIRQHRWHYIWPWCEYGKLRCRRVERENR